MKNITKVNDYIFHIVSEPGDTTHYDYIMARDHDEYMFMTYGNDFRYPQRINYWDVVDFLTLVDDDQITIAKKYDCNYFTFKECVKTIMEVHHG